MTDDYTQELERILREIIAAMNTERWLNMIYRQELTDKANALLNSKNTNP